MTGPDRSLGVAVEEAQGGSVAAFEQIYATLAPSVASYLRWHGVRDVPDLTNDVFARVHSKLGSFRGDEQGFRSWVFTIAHHRMVDDRRRASRQVPLDPHAEVSETAVRGDAEADALAALGDERVAELLAVLSPDQRAVLLLRVVGDLSVEAAAEALGKRPGAIKALQHRALNTLRRHLTSAGEADREDPGA